MKRVLFTNDQADALEELLRLVLTTMDGDRPRARMRREKRLRHLSLALKKLKLASRLEAPKCGHSACRQNWIDTGQRGCVAACGYCGGRPGLSGWCCDDAAKAS